jgi:general nucleoside transport system permease protein
VRRRRVLSSGLTVSIAAGAAALVLSSLLTTVVGASPIDAFREIWNGAFGGSYAVGVTFTKALPLGFVALGFAVAFRSGVFNIGLEGQLYMGGLAGALVGGRLHAPAAVALPVTLLAAAAGGGLWALIPAVLKLARNANEIVVSLMLNYVAIFIVNYLIGGPVKDPAAIYPQTAEVLPSAQLPVLVSGTNINAGLIVIVGAAVLVWFLLKRTVLGYEMETVGASPRVARYVGIDVRRTTLVAFLVSGALGGLAGAVEVLGNQFRLVENFSPGWGYTGIVVALLGAANPWGCLLAAFYFGLLGSGADQLQFRLGVPAAFVLIVQALAVIFVLASGWLYEQWLRRVSRRPAYDRPPDNAPLDGVEP